ncbi:hypothetical protein ACF1BU_24750 [Streptomyces sp. NPDC014724]|uniref:hypothetical protein n=1 Tax=unclassified Streptomyces TaxID=2593676 RepID=UPI0037016D83
MSRRLREELPAGPSRRVRIAMALAQQADLLLLGEPTTIPDARRQISGAQAESTA